MPIKSGKNKNGPYYQWGSATKYYYNANSAKSKTTAYNKAVKQARAIFASGYRPK